MKIVSDVTRAGLMNPVWSCLDVTSHTVVSLRYFIACLAGGIVMCVRKGFQFDLFPTSRGFQVRRHKTALPRYKFIAGYVF